MEILTSLQDNVDKIKSVIKCDDVVFFNFNIDKTPAVACYVDTISDKQIIGKQILTPLKSEKFVTAEDILQNITLPEGEIILTLTDAVKKLINGDTVIFIDGQNKCISASSKKFENRSCQEPPTSSVLKGPRIGFVESVQTNLSLIRQRLKTADFVYTKFTVGKYSQTTIGLCYISSIANENIVEEIKKKLQKINVDGVVDSSYVIKSISSRKTSLFKEVGTTEKPDILCAKLLEGRVGILVDGSPICLTAPYVIMEDFQSSEDYYTNVYRADCSRLIRLLAVAIAILLPAFYVASELYHLQFIPLNFLLTIINSIKGIPLSPSVEMFVTLLIFEILNEASIRMPKYVGIAMSVVGALVLGETAVNAGIVSTPTIMIIAISGICLYTVPDLMESLSVLRILFLTVAGVFGGYGIILFGTGIVIYLCSLQSFGIPYLAPYSPLIINDLQDGFFMGFFAQMKKRPKIFKTKNVYRKAK